jgi:hypothetical protein
VRIERVAWNESPTFTNPPPSGTVAVNGVYGPHSFTIDDREWPADQLVVTATSSNTSLLPNENISVTGSGPTRTITATPAPGQSGSTDITVTVTDPDGGSTSTDVTVNVTNNNAPVLTVGDQGITEGSTLVFRALATDADPGDQLSYALEWHGTDGQPTATPWNVTFDSAAAIFLWAPDESQGPGEYTAVIRVTDNGDVPLEDAETIRIDVAEQNLRPTISGPGYPDWYWPRAVQVGFSSPTDPNVNVSFSVSAYDNDIPTQNLSYEPAR